MLVGVWLGFLLCCMMNTSSGQQYWKLESYSTLRVDGKTNINSFNCEIDSYGRHDTLWTAKIKEDFINAGGDLDIHLMRFDCHHKVMTKDLQKTLKANEFPHMRIRFTRFYAPLEKVVKPVRIQAEADIVLAGITRHFHILLTAQPHGEQVLLIGTKQILFSDFQLKPPSKLGGTIKVKNELLVEFKLYLSPM